MIKVIVLLLLLLLGVLQYLYPYEGFVSTAEMDDLHDTFDRASDLQFIIK